MTDLRSQTIYYIVVDRFSKGNSESNIKKDPDDYDISRTDWNKYWGGDIEGVIEKLDYLKDLGITAIWLSPIFELTPGLEDFEKRGSNKFFGYWPKDFKHLNPNLITKSEDVELFERNNSVFHSLVREIHKRDMKIILDIVCNYSDSRKSFAHTATYYNGKLLTSSDDDFLNWYHHYENEKEELQNRWQDENLAITGYSHFNENKSGFRHYLMDVMKCWLNIGVDGFAINNIKNMPPWFWQEFISEMRSFKDNFFAFGEWFQGGCNNELSFIFSNATSIPLQDFSLQKAIENCFIKNFPGGFYLIDDVFKKDCKFKNANELITFIDCNSLPRFLSGSGNFDHFELALNLLLTGRGIPVIFYGNEQLLQNDTNGGLDPFNRPMMERWDHSTKIYQNIKKLTELRRNNIAIQRGYLQTRYITENIFVFTRKYGGNFCVVAMNKGQEKSFDVAGIEIPDGIYDDILSDKKISVENHRIVHLTLQENETVVISKHSLIAKDDTMITFQLNGYNTHYGEIIKIVGSIPELGEWDIEKSPELQYINSNTWMGDVSIKVSSGKTVYYKYAVIDRDKFVKYENRMARNRIIPLSGQVIWKNEWL